MGRVVPQFSGLARVWAVRLRVLHCKITKNRISGRARAKKNFAGFKISAHTRPVRFVGGHGADRPCRAKNAQVYLILTNYGPTRVERTWLA
jgi:hypothetical protein